MGGRSGREGEQQRANAQPASPQRGAAPGKLNRSGQASSADAGLAATGGPRSAGIQGSSGGLDDWEMTPELCAAMGVDEPASGDAVAPGGMVVQRKAANAPAAPSSPSPEGLAQLGVVRNKLTELRAPLALVRRHANMIETVHFKGNTFVRMSQGIAQYNAAISQLPPPVNQLTGLSAFAAGEPQAAIAAVAVPAPALVALLEAIAVAVEAATAIALAELLLIIAALALLLYAIYLALKAIVEAIEEAIEAMRPMPPIFWSASLPPPPALTFVRTKPPNPRVPGGQQDRVAAAIRASGQQGTMVAHHVLPLFLGGRDDNAAPPNVVPWSRALHIAGHASLMMQPHMAIWGYSPSLYMHPPPAGYFLAGFKVP